MSIRTKGFETPAQLREHMQEIEEAMENGVSPPAPDAREWRALRIEIAALSREVDELRQRLETLSRRVDKRGGAERREDRPWLGMLGAALATFAMTRISERLRLGAAGAAAVPLLAAGLGRHIGHFQPKRDRFGTRTMR